MDNGSQLTFGSSRATGVVYVLNLLYFYGYGYYTLGVNKPSDEQHNNIQKAHVLLSEIDSFQSTSDRGHNFTCASDPALTEVI